MNLRKFISLTTALFIFSTAHLIAQNTMEMTVEQLFELVEKGNVDVKVAQKNLELTQQLEKSAVLQRTPELSFHAEVDLLGNAYVLDRDFTHPELSPLPRWGNAFSVEVYQPLYEGGAIQAEIDKARQTTKMAGTQLEMTTDKIKIDVLECYINLLKYSNLLNVYDENIELTQQLISEMQARTQQGIVLANDVTRYELILSNLNYDRFTVDNAIKHLNYCLVLYLKLEEGTQVIPMLDLNNAKVYATTLEQWKEMALQLSPELKYLQLEQQNSLVEQKMVKSRMIPKIGVVAGDNLDAPITSTSPVLNKNLNAWWVGVKLSADLSALYKQKHNLKAAKLETNRLEWQYEAEQENLLRKIDQTYKYFQQAGQQVITQKKNVELAAENYRIIERRYYADLALLTDMLDASTAKLEAEVQLVNAQANEIFYYFQMKYITGNI